MAKKEGGSLKDEILAVQNRILQGMIGVSETMALNAKALIVRNLDTTGIPGYTYSKNPLPLFFLTGNAKTAGGKAAIEKLAKQRKKAGLPGVSYEDLRQVEGLPTDHVTFSFSNETLRNTGIIATRQVGDKFISVLGGLTPDAKNKLMWGRDRYGNIFAKVLGEEGKTLLKEVAAAEIKKLAQKI